MKNKKLSLILAVQFFLCSVNLCVPKAINAQTQSVNYVFTGRESALAGYAEGKVTISAGEKTGYCILFWADENGILSGYEKIAAIKINSNEPIEYNMPENMAIPDGASRLAVYFADTEDYVPTGLSDAAVYDIPQSKQFDSGNLEMTFASVSDIHVNYNSSDPNSDNYCGAPYKWTQALNYFAELNLDMVNISGDCTSVGGASEYEVYTQSINASNYDPSKVYMARGNHDSQENDNFINYTSRDDMIRPFEKSPWFYVLKKGDAGEKDNLFIYLAQELTSISNTNLQDNFSTAQLDWLENLLKTYAGTNTNIFIIEHALYHNWGPGDRYDGLYVQPIMLNDSFAGNMRLQKLLMEYKEAVFMTGHSHLAFREMVNYSDENNTACRMIHNSSTSQLRVYNPDGKSIRYRAEGVDNVSGSEGYVVGVYENDIVYNGTNLTTKERIPTACYIFPSYVENRSRATSINITVPPTKTVYNEGEYFNAAGMAVTASYPDGTAKQVQGWGIKDNTALSKDDTAVTIVYGELEATVPIKIKTIADGFAGSGTKDDPYLIQNEEDFALLTKCFESIKSTDSNDPNTFGKGMYFMQTADLDMTKCSDYQGTNASGSAKYGFSGVYNGGGHRIKVNLSTSGTDLSVFPYVNGVVMNVNFEGSISASSYAQPIRTIGSNGRIINCSAKMALASGTANGLSLSNYGTVIRYFSSCEFGDASVIKNVYSNTNKDTTVYINCMYDGGQSDSNGTKVTSYTDTTKTLNAHTSSGIAESVEILKKYNPDYNAADINLWQADMTVAAMVKSDTEALSMIKSDVPKPVSGNNYAAAKTISNYSDKNIEIFAYGAIYDTDGKLSAVKHKKTVIPSDDTKDIDLDFGILNGDMQTVSVYLWDENMKPYFPAE